MGAALVLSDGYRPAPGRVLAPLEPARPDAIHLRPARRGEGAVMKLSGMRPRWRRWSALLGVRGGRHEAGRHLPGRTGKTDGETMPVTSGAAEYRPELRCARCDEPIQPWHTGEWVHLGPRGTFWCRDELGLVTQTLAVPPELVGPAIGSVPSSVVDAMVLSNQGGAG